MTQQLLLSHTEDSLAKKLQHQQQFINKQQQYQNNIQSQDLDSLLKQIQQVYLKQQYFIQQAQLQQQILLQMQQRKQFLEQQQKQKQQQQKKYTLVLDLDETLIHTYSLDKNTVDFYERPNYEAFLKKMSKNYEIVIFTAALESYAKPIIDCIDPEGYISGRLYRQHMRNLDGKWVKDLRVLNRDLSKTILVDNLEDNLKAQRNNGYLIEDFLGDKNDRELEKLEKVLDYMVENQVEDIREVLLNLIQQQSSNEQIIQKPNKIQKIQQSNINNNVDEDNESCEELVESFQQQLVVENQSQQMNAKSDNNCRLRGELEENCQQNQKQKQVYTEQLTGLNNKNNIDTGDSEIKLNNIPDEVDDDLICSSEELESV